MSVVEVNGLRAELAAQRVDILDEVALSIDAGEVLGLVGESGSGKTTVGLAMLGHTRRGVRITAGEIRFGDIDLLSIGPAQLRALRGKSVSYVPQDPSAALNPALRIGNQLEETLEAHHYGESHQARLARLQEMMGEVALPAEPAFLRRYPHQLSGGQQQRVALALAFACRPRLIVLDEPTTGLDVTTQAHILETVRELCRTHQVAALYISHDLAVVANLADRVAVMYAGRIVELGLQSVLFRAAAHPYTRGLVEAIPEISGQHELHGIAGSAPPPGDRPSGCFFAPRCAFAIDRCHQDFPEPAWVSTGHLVRCHRHEDVLAASLLERPAASRVHRPDSTPSLVGIQNISASYEERQVVFDVNLTIQRQECLALVGESGSGKTTLARCLAGIHRQVSGGLTFRGEPLPLDARRRQADTRRQIQIIFQSPYTSLNPRKTIGQLVGQPLQLYFDLSGREEYERVGEALTRVSLNPSLADRYPHELSGGERQRVAIARALVADPAVLICDEITSSLDVSVQAAIVDLIAALQREMGLGVLFVTHNLALIRTIADRVAVMNDGRVVEYGGVDDVFDSPQAAYTQSLLADTPTLDKGVGEAWRAKSVSQLD
jgi:peptide/nickel transport system ATP-binding protein